GSDRVHLFGAGLDQIGTPTVMFGGLGAPVLEVAPQSITVSTPRGRGTVDVVVSSAVGRTVVPTAYTYVPPELAARYGNVNVGRANRENVLLLNALTGDPERREIGVAAGQPLQCVLNSPSSRASSRYVVYAWRGAPSLASFTTLPRSVGSI